MKKIMLLLVLLLPVTAEASNEPDAFVGIRWGASIEDGYRILWDRSTASSPIKCEDESGRRFQGAEPATQMQCQAMHSVGGVPLNGTYRFTTQGFTSVEGWFLSPLYDRLKIMFTEKYGPPTATTAGEVTNRAGARLENERLEWVGERVVIRLSRIGGRLDMGTFSASTRAADDALTERTKALLKKGKDNL
jgi:hypothetical protein